MRTYPYYAGRERFRGNKKCSCCAEPSGYTVSIQTSWFRGDDLDYFVCEAHSSIARYDFDGFSKLVEKRAEYMRQTVNAQHEETGRRWTGERRNLPPRYQEIPDEAVSQ